MHQSFTRVGGQFTLRADSSLQTSPNFVSAMTGLGDDDALQAITEYLVSTSQPTLFKVSPTISRDGTLRFTPVTGQGGTATVTVRARDKRRKGEWRNHISAARTFTITLTDTRRPLPIITTERSKTQFGITNIFVDFGEPITGFTSSLLKVFPSTSSLVLRTDLGNGKYLLDYDGKVGDVVVGVPAGCGYRYFCQQEPKSCGIFCKNLMRHSRRFSCRPRRPV